MTRNGKLKVGQDLDSPETVRTQLMGQTAAFIADVWRKHIYPTPYDRTFNIGGTRVRVQVGEAADDGGALKRLQELTSDQSIDK